MSFYGRDDVHPALELQKLLEHKISRGFRPVIPMLRGGAKPPFDCAVTLPLTTLDVNQKSAVQVCLPALTDLAGTDSGRSNDEAATQDVSPELTVQIVQARSSASSF